MTIKWVKVDPLVMRGEPFCYNTRLTVRQLLELRRDGYGVAQLLTAHPELRVVGIAAGLPLRLRAPRPLRRLLRPRRRPGRPRLHRGGGIHSARGSPHPGRRGARPRAAARGKA